jgi:hypothetical protein
MSGLSRHLTRLRDPQAFRRAILGSGILLLVAGTNYIFDGPHSVLLLAVGIVLVTALLLLAFMVTQDRIDFRLQTLVDGNLSDFKVVAHDFPEYRFVDVFRAIEAHVAGETSGTLESQHLEDLGPILVGNFYGGAGFINTPPHVPCSVGPQQDEHLPAERYWFIGPPGARKTIVRLRRIESAASAKLELADKSLSDAERLFTELRERSCEASIYRGQALEVSFEPGIKDEWGGVDQAGRVKVAFRQSAPVAAEEMVLDPRVWPIVHHSLISFLKNRDALAERGVMLKRGFLFYGPPGTGKSFTARYLATQLEGTTFIHCSGAALRHLSSVFNLARLLKPAIIVMDDVDLVFSSRDVNHRADTLGDLFDQIDAVADTDPINVVMTTNAIERVEAAVKDRPGRISQCIFFGPPSAELRRRYLEAQLRNHDAHGVDLDEVVKRTDGATQAYLKELSHRALQFALEAGRTTDEHVLRPTTIDFIAALGEINSFDSKAARSITGFRLN